MRPLYYFKPRHYWNILIAQIVVLFIAAFMEDHPVLYALFILALFGIFGSVISRIWSSRITRLLSFVCMVVALVAGDLWLIRGIGERMVIEGFVVASFSYATFVLIAIGAMFKNVFVTDEVTSDRIVGSICIYLLIGMFFAFIFSALDLINPVMFNFGHDADPTIREFREYLYFSYTTITTLGYGDMLPTHPLSRLLTSLEAMIGPVYLAIVVARLVGMHISKSMEKRAKG
jgi:hypothetical protein